MKVAGLFIGACLTGAGGGYLGTKIDPINYEKRFTALEVEKDGIVKRLDKIDDKLDKIIEKVYQK